MPITIGELTTVPAPGDPVTSPWAQTLSNQYVIHQFSSVADRDAKWTSPPNGAWCVTLDTGYLWQRRAGAWEQVAPRPHWSALIGTMNGFGSTNTNVDVPGMAVTVPAINAHRYRINYTMAVQSVGGAIIGLSVTLGDNTQLQNTTAQIGANTYSQLAAVYEYTAVATGSIVFKCRLFTTSAPININAPAGGPACLYVDDQGI